MPLTLIQRSRRLTNPPKYVIAWPQPNGTSEPWDVGGSSYINSAPYDGITVWTSHTRNLMFGPGAPYNYTYSTFYNALLDAVTANTAQRDLWVLAGVSKPGPWATVADWAQSLANWGHMAKAAKDLGFRGILWDNEPYNRESRAPYNKSTLNVPQLWGILTNPPDDPADIENTNSDRPYARQYGRDMAQAILAQWPGVHFFVANGPASADQVAKDAGKITSYTPDWQLNAECIFGMMEKFNDYPNSIFIDGNGSYEWDTDAEKSISYNLRKSGMSHVPSGIVNTFWQSPRYQVGFVDYNQNWPLAVPKTLSLFETTVENSVQYADFYTAVYIEPPGQGFGNNPGNWVTPNLAGNDPAVHDKPWLDAITRAKNIWETQT